MAVKIRLTRRGRKKRAMYDVIVADARSPRDGRLIEKLGTYNPLTNPATISIDEEKSLEWLLKGAQPTDTARRILSHRGIMLKKHLQIGVLKGAITQEQADKKFDDWIKGKEAEISSAVSSIEKKKAAEAKAKFDAETKVKEAKAEAIKQKLAALEPADEVTEVAEETNEEEAVALEASVVEATPAAEEKPVVEETPTETAKVEEPVGEAKEEAPTKEDKAEEPKTEAKEEPVAETKEELKAEAKAEVKKDTPAEEPKDEAKEEAKADEAPVKEEKVEEPKAEKEETPAEEKKEEDKK